jgi:formimidoylglutamate deiminase
MARHYRLQSALIDNAWANDVRVVVGDDGLIQAIEAHPAAASGQGATESSAAPPTAERLNGYVVPGMANAHSHAFQRAMVGDTEYRLSARDSFWTWRQAMYALANRITAADLEALSTQLFIEMLKSGYTSVAEFHYLHREPDGTLGAGTNPLWDAATRAADAAGIGLTFLPTLYQTSDFGSKPLRQDQGRFQLDTDRFLRAIEERISTEGRLGTSLRRTGAAFHSLRAVPIESLRQAVDGLRAIDPQMPVHIHIAEQIKEVEACREHTGRRPIEFLLDTGLVDRHWCLVHATHATPAELKGIAAASAAVCVSITTEANLGDGFFDAPRFLSAGGKICVGSDSQATVCPAEELRWMEYQARLRKRRRSVLAEGSRSHVGTRLWRDAARHGASALGQPVGTIAVGSRADWLVLDPEHPSMVGSAPDTALDRLLFAGASAAIRDVMVAGRWVVKDRHHAAEAASLARFRDLMDRLRTVSSIPASSI